MQSFGTNGDQVLPCERSAGMRTEASVHDRVVADEGDVRVVPTASKAAPTSS